MPLGKIMNNCPLISIIVPVYNTEAFLAECIESVLSQTYGNIELLLIDDGSTDGSARICGQYEKKDPRVRLFRKENGGISSARNLGIENAKGDYIMFADSDDRIEPECAELLYRLCLEQGAAFAAGGMYSVPGKKKTSAAYTVWKGTDGLRESLKDNPFTYTACAKLYSRELIGDTRFRIEDRTNEDTFFVFQLLCKQPVFAAAETNIYFYRDNPSSVTHSAFADKFFDVPKIAEDKYARIGKEFPELLPLAENVRIKAGMNLLKVLACRTSGKYCALQKKLLSDIRKNRQYFIAATDDDRKWFRIITRHLYHGYCLLQIVKSPLRRCKKALLSLRRE